MTDKERREDEALKNCIQEAYGCSDDQLLAELEEIEESLSDSDFPGVEERIYEKLMARVEEERSIERSTIITDTKGTMGSEKKIIKLQKRKLVLVAIAASLFAGILGISTIGNNNYFLRRDEKQRKIILDSGKNVQKLGSLEEAYIEAEQQLGFPIMKLSYLPSELVFEELLIVNNKATFVFSYKDKKVYLIQEKESKEISASINSDREDAKVKIHNTWIAQDIPIEKNPLDNENVEYSAVVCINDIKYRFIGIIPEEEFLEIIKNLNV